MGGAGAARATAPSVGRRWPRTGGTGPPVVGVPAGLCVSSQALLTSPLFCVSLQPHPVVRYSPQSDLPTVPSPGEGVGWEHLSLRHLLLASEQE